MKWADDIAPLIARPETAGTVGSILAFIRAPGESLPAKAFNLLSGIATAIFVFPYALEMSGITSQAGAIAFSFILGLISMNLVAKTIDWGSKLTVEDFWNFVAKFRPGGRRRRWR